MELSLTTVANGAAVAGCVAIVGLALKQTKSLVRIETLLTGANGENGIVGDLKKLSSEADDRDQTIVILTSRVDKHEYRIDGVERRVGPTDRRANA